jgi:hypothetical protein
VGRAAASPLIAEINDELREFYIREHKERHDVVWMERVETLIDEELLDSRHGERRRQPRPRRQSDLPAAPRPIAKAQKRS